MARVTPSHLLLCYNIGMRLINLIGNRYGNLVVVERTYRTRNKSSRKDILWRCLCDCGKEAYIRGFCLRDGMTKSCGCRRLALLKQHRKEDLIGLKFYRLLVVERLSIRNKSGRVNNCVFRCLCDCGNARIVQGSHLRSGSTKSCGCLKREMLPSTKYLAGSHFVLKTYKKSAISRKLEWTISDEEAAICFHSNCYYCGIRPSSVITPPDRTVSVDYAYNGIDRLDSSKGYIAGNVVACCTRCNYSKRNYSVAEFLDMARAVAEQHPIKK